MVRSVNAEAAAASRRRDRRLPRVAAATSGRFRVRGGQQGGLAGEVPVGRWCARSTRRRRRLRRSAHRRSAQQAARSVEQRVAGAAFCAVRPDSS
jgi:hypothetical protein